MQSLHSKFLASFWLAAAVLCHAQAIDTVGVDRAVADTLRLWRVPGAAVAITGPDRVLYLKGFGVKELGRTDAVTPDTRFAIGSTTKAFTTAAMAMLVDEGKMSWDDPVRKHLEYFHLSDPLADRDVILRDIVSHRTGLSRHDLLWYASPLTREEIIRRIGQVKLTRPFRTTYQYQNIMFLAAGEAVAHAAGISWDEFVRRRIFTPLGMTNSDTSVNAVLGCPDHASPHARITGSTATVIPWRNIDNIGPAGSINSSASDLARWLQFHLNGGTVNGKRLVSERNLNETYLPNTVIRLDEHLRMLTDEMTQLSYAMGWFVNDYRGCRIVSHGGAIDGFRAIVTLLPKQKIGIAILTNLGQLNVPEALRDQLVDIVLGLPPLDWNKRYLARALADQAEDTALQRELTIKKYAGTRPSRDLAAYAGTYIDPAYGAASVTVDGDALVLSWSSFKTKLDHRYFDTFLLRDQELGRGPAVFHLGEDGEVQSLNMLGTEFHRAKKEGE